jgi:hypothetical protein
MDATAEPWCRATNSVVPSRLRSMPCGSGATTTFVRICQVDAETT